MCDCITTTNAELAKDGLSLLVSIPLSAGVVSKPLIPLLRTDNWSRETRRGKPHHYVPSFCPMCGEKYQKATTVDGWRPKETAPRDGTLFEGRYQGGDPWRIRYDRGWFYTDGEQSEAAFDEWRPVAEPKPS